MSTILDSLKKSSDQRDDDNGRSIDKFTFSDQKKSSKRLLWLLLLLIVLLAAYFGYDHLYQQDDQMVDQDQTSQSEQVKNTNVKSNADAKPADLALVDPKKQQVDDKRAAPKKPKPNTEQVKKEMLSLKRQKNNDMKTEQTAQLKKQKTDEIATLTMPEMTEKSTDIKTKPALKEIQNNGRQGRVGAKRDTPRAQQKRAAEQQKYLFLYQLPFAIRKDIPKLKLNIHVFDEDPEKRIAILNGVRFAIDDTIEEGIFLKDIVEEGAVLEAAGQEFLIPK